MTIAFTSKVKCRPIGTADLASIATLLARGFPARPRGYWVAGLERLARRKVPEGMQRFGFMLEHEGTAVGAILVIAQTISHDGPPFVRCNVSSWYVEPAFRSNAAMLSMLPLRTKNATILNISAAPNTWSTIEAQGFRRYTAGQRITWPAFASGDPALRVRLFDVEHDADMPDAALLADHAEAGCLALIGDGPDGRVPFALLPFRAKQGRLPLPVMQVVFCRALADIARFARPLGRYLIRRGMPFLLFDVPDAAPIVPGRFLKNRARKYVRGAHTPAFGDLAYTEFTIFGP